MSKKLKVSEAYLFKNGNIIIFDDKGNQMVELQEALSKKINCEV